MKIKILYLIGMMTFLTTLQAGPAPANQEKVAAETIVHTAQFDKLYHMNFCVRLKSSFNPRKLTIKAAIDKGLKPCDRCQPPQQYVVVKKKANPAPKKKVTTGKPTRQAPKEPSTILFTDNYQVAVNSKVDTVYKEPLNGRYYSKRGKLPYKNADQCVEAETRNVLNSDIMEGATHNVRRLIAEYIAEEACSELMSRPERCFVVKRNRYIAESDKNEEFFTVIEAADEHARNVCR